MVHFWWHKSVPFCPRQLLMVTHSKLQLEGFGMSWLLQYVWSMDARKEQWTICSTALHFFLVQSQASHVIYLAEFCTYKENCVAFNIFVHLCWATSHQNWKRVLLKASISPDKKHVSGLKRSTLNEKVQERFPKKICTLSNPRYKINILK